MVEMNGTIPALIVAGFFLFAFIGGLYTNYIEYIAKKRCERELERWLTDESDPDLLSPDRIDIEVRNVYKTQFRDIECKFELIDLDRRCNITLRSLHYMNHSLKDIPMLNKVFEKRPEDSTARELIAEISNIRDKWTRVNNY